MNDDLYVYLAVYAYDDFSDVGIHIQGIYLDADQAALSIQAASADALSQAGRLVTYDTDKDTADLPIRAETTYVLKVKVDQRRAGDA